MLCYLGFHRVILFSISNTKSKELKVRAEKGCPHHPGGKQHSSDPGYIPSTLHAFSLNSADTADTSSISKFRTFPVFSGNSLSSTWRVHYLLSPIFSHLESNQAVYLGKSCQPSGNLHLLIAPVHILMQKVRHIPYQGSTIKIV